MLPVLVRIISVSVFFGGWKLMIGLLQQAGEYIEVHEWIIPFVQSVHILAIAAVVGSVLALELRIAGFLAMGTALLPLARRFVPVLWFALPVLLVTGLILVVGEPYRTLGNWVFWTKMALVVCMTLLTLAIRRPLTKTASASRESARPAAFGAWLMLTGWLAIIVCGRFIAYAGNNG